MKSMDDNEDIKLPEALVQQLQEFEKQLRLAETLVAVFGGLSGFLASFGLFFIFDRCGDTPVAVRVLLTAAGTALCCWLAWFWFHRWMWRRRDTRQLARLIQRKYSRLGDSLLGAVELTQARAEGFSPALCRAALRQVAASAGQYSFRKAVAMRFPRICLWSSLGLFAIFLLAPAILFPAAVGNTLGRWFRPMADITRYTFVVMTDLPGELMVPHGESFPVACGVTASSRWQWQPQAAKCRFERQPRLTSPIVNGQAHFKLPGQTKPGNLVVRAGDDIRNIPIKPVYRPEITALAAEINLPSYLGYPICTNRVEGGRLELLADSQFRLFGTASRALRSATLRGGPDNALIVASNHFASVRLPAAVGTGALECIWTDIFGINGAAPYVVNLAVVQDEAPQVTCSGVDRVVAILEDETLKFETQAEDDYGLRALWFDWAWAPADSAATEAEQNSHLVQNGTNTCRTLSGSLVFSPINMGIPEESTVALCACANDYYPGREPARSTEYLIYILSKTRHAQLLQEKLEKMYAKLDDAAREEERLLDSNRQPGMESNKVELAANAEDEGRNAEKLGQMAEEAKDLLKEALRNTEIGKDTLSRLAEMAKAMQQIMGDMQQAKGSLQQSKASEAPQSKEHLNQATQKEQEALEAMKAMEKQMDRSIEDMAAKGFVNRLQAAAAKEKEIGATLKQILPSTIGTRPKDLPAEAKKKLEGMEALQKRTRKDAQNIQKDLAGFFNRTRLKQYDEIDQEMKEKKMPEELEKLAEMLKENLGVKAMAEAGNWEKQFKEWADKLSKRTPNEGGGGDEGGGGEMSEGDMELMMALMRSLQRESNLREQTRDLDENKENNKNYEDAANKLAELQKTDADEVRQAEAKAKIPDLKKLAKQVERLMQEATGMLKEPNTGEDTIAVETEIIEMITQAFEGDDSGNGSGKSQAAQMMAMLMQAMGLGKSAGPMGGGSTAGGTTTDLAKPVAGGVGTAPDPRAITGLGGKVGEWPAEFRDTLEAYFAALEKNN